MKKSSIAIISAVGLALASAAPVWAQTMDSNTREISNQNNSNAIETPPAGAYNERLDRQSMSSEDVQQHASRNARSSAEEEHGGVLGWAGDKLHRTANRMHGMSSRGTMVNSGLAVDDSGGLAANGHVTGR